MAVATLHYIHDPLCGWCYAAQPLVSAVADTLGDRVSIRLHGGGLFDEARTLDPELAAHIVHADERIGSLSGQPFGKPYLEGLLAEQGTVLFSLPPTAALLAADALDAGKAYPLLVAIQNAHYQRGLRVVEPSVLTELAVEAGVDGDAFERSFAQLQGTATIEHLQASRRLLREVGGQGFPTMALEIHGKRQILPHHYDYGRPAAFVNRVAALLPAVH
ncbi:DsbA family protein [Dyella soli]|uniref:DsbA family protein n=1 Tax=Dyella soli TaxID=522319 RepID=A0A4R0YNI8_9GAMM|nr:DsbA family protein [Dyella soli]TCI10346.1 DsbA family protein [Dyella soli]